MWFDLARPLLVGGLTMSDPCDEEGLVYPSQEAPNKGP